MRDLRVGLKSMTDYGFERVDDDINYRMWQGVVSELKFPRFSSNPRFPIR